MASPQQAPMPYDVSLWDGCTIRVSAVDPATGNAVAGVTVSGVSYDVDQTKGSAQSLETGPFMLVTGPAG